MSIRDFLLALATPRQPAVDIPERRLPGLSEEYTALRTELVHIQVSVRTLWGSMFGFFLTAVAAFFGIVAHDTKKLKEIADAGEFSWASGILLLIIILGIHLVDLWMRHSFYIGSYIVVVHEGHNPSLQWHTRNRRAAQNNASPLQHYAVNLADSFAQSSALLAWFAIVVFLIGIWLSHEKLSTFSFNIIFSDPPFVGGVCFVLVLFFVGCHKYRHLKNIQNERQKMEDAWRCEINN